MGNNYRNYWLCPSSKNNASRFMKVQVLYMQYRMKNQEKGKSSFKMERIETLGFFEFFSLSISFASVQTCRQDSTRRNQKENGRKTRVARKSTQKSRGNGQAAMAMRLFLEWPFLYQSIRSFLDAMDITRGQRRQEEEIDRSISEPVKVSKWKWHQYQSL